MQEENNKFKHQDDYFQRQLEKGLQRVTVWIPKGTKHLVQLFAKNLRKGNKKGE